MFVDLTEEPAAFYVAPESWVENDIHVHHKAFLDEHGGRRPINPKSTHHGIGLDRIIAWHDRWDLVGL